MATNEIPEVALKQFARLINSHPDMELKGGGKMQYTSMNGNMYTLVGKTGDAGLRLSDEDAREFIETFGAGPLIQYGAVMRGYVQIPPDVLGDTDVLRPWLERSHEHAKTLPTKPTKKP
jgi:hypothetical protein